MHVRSGALALACPPSSGAQQPFRICHRLQLRDRGLATAPPPTPSSVQRLSKAMGLLVEPSAAAVQPDILLGAVGPEVEAAAAPKRTYFRPVCGCP